MVIEKGVLILPRHVFLVTCLWSVIIAIDTNAATGYSGMLCSKSLSGERGISIEMILCLVFKRVFLGDALHTIATSNGIPDELYLPFRKCGSLNK